MPWTYEINSTLQMIEVTYTGQISEHDLMESTSTIIALEKEKDLHRILVETRKVQLIASLADILNLPATQYLEEDADRLGCVAIVLPDSPREKEAVLFYEMACKNRGWTAQTFLHRQAAMNWLLSTN